ncbi:MAG: TetR/AcrR family transcriptional regulator [Desulfobacterales bacterium]|nr:TetR/AcrR family transcriptional regulator [Desulfobacterales bacterium]MCP4162785.1 TetR/AcrR family transcriptional regulator [Deltaproteobacteria bacterium]
MAIQKTDRKEKTKNKLIKSVGKALSKYGFKGLGINKVAREAGVDKVLIYRYFGGLPELLKEYSLSIDFWPSLKEILGDDPEFVKTLKSDEQVAYFFKKFLAALRRRPITQDILALEVLERNELTKQLEYIRIRTALEYFEHIDQIPDDKNLSAIVVLMGGAINYLIIRSRITTSVGGIDLESEKGWDSINDGIDLLLKGIFD